MRRPKLDRIDPALRKRIEDYGWQTLGLQCACDDDPGRPDLLAVRHGRFVLVEFKDPDDGRLSKGQISWHTTYRGGVDTLIVVKTTADVDRFFGQRH